MHVKGNFRCKYGEKDIKVASSGGSVKPVSDIFQLLYLMDHHYQSLNVVTFIVI